MRRHIQKDLRKSLLQGIEEENTMQKLKRHIIYVAEIVLCIVLIFLIFPDEGFACTGSCLSCHPNLNLKRKEHVVIKRCIDCHASGCGKVRNFSGIPDTNNNYEGGHSENMNHACGGSCFKCHSSFPDNTDHKAMFSCCQCHSMSRR